MERKAVIVFADSLGLDLARRRLPAALRALFAAGPLAHAPAGAAVHLFTSGEITARPGLTIHRQRGATFAARLEAAVEEIAALGYAEIALVGRDCPALRASDLATAFRQLGNKRLVLGPDHRGGCYLIALHAADRALLQGVRWKRNTDCAELIRRAGTSAVHLLAIKHDLDSWRDVQLAARADAGVARVLQVLSAAHSLGARALTTFVHAVTRFVRLHGQMPPPVCAG